MGKKAISYLRFSSAEQADGHSEARQSDAAEEYCKKHGLELDERFYDRGISGYDGSNLKASFGAILKNIKNGSIPKGTWLLVEALDRLSRDKVFEQLRTFMDIIDSGITIVTLMDNTILNKQSLDENSTLLYDTINKMARGNDESKTKSSRGRDNWAEKRKNAASKPLTSILPSWLKMDKKGRIKKIKNRADVVKEIYELSLSGCGKRSIAKTLNQRKEPIWSSKTRNKSGLWTDSYIQKILTNPAVIGEFQPHTKIDGKRQPTGDVIPTYFPPVIDKKLFYAVQNRKKKRIHKGGRAVDKGHNLFTSIAYCSICGTKLAYKDKGNGWEYLVCQNKMNGILCNAKNIKYSFVEEFILQGVMAHRWGEITGKDNGLGELKFQLESKEAEKKVKKKKASNIADAIEQAEVVIPTLINRMADAESQITKIDVSIDDIKGKIASLELSTATADEAWMYAVLSSSRDNETVRRKLKSLVADQIKQIFVQHSSDATNLVVVLHNEKVLVGKTREKSLRPSQRSINEYEITVLKPWQMDNSRMRYALSYKRVWSDSLKVVDADDRLSELCYKPYIITFKKGENPISKLANQSSHKVVSKFLPLQSKTKGIRALNTEIKEQFEQELDDYESLAPMAVIHDDSTSLGMWGKSTEFRDIVSAQRRALRRNLN